jgi:ribosomal protein L40E
MPRFQERHASGNRYQDLGFGTAHPIRLLRGVTAGATCMACHGGQVAQKDLRSDFAKPSAHRIDAYVGIHDPAENPLSMPLHVECVDCPDPHEARADSIIGQVPGPPTGVSGVDVTGGFRSDANFEYEVCLKCNASESPSPVVFRVDDITNVRLKINSSNMSFHPIAASGKKSADPRPSSRMDGCEPDHLHQLPQQ